jgi:glutathione synthase/RimK-type ligase-like ATP-grasp enzyme
LDPAITDEAARLFAWSEANEALLGLWYSLDCFWMNPPLADEVALRKIRQLQVATRVGLTIPETLVTNEPAVALDFIRQYEPGGVIRKAFRNIQEAPRTTAVVREPDLSLIGLVRYTPVIFQRFVPARLDLRVTIVDGEVFAAAIESGPEFQADYRTGLASARVTPYELPSPVTERLMEMMDVFNLSYGAIDLRVTPDGEHVFLEVNPAGEYRFISERTGQPISAAIAAALARHAEGTTAGAFGGTGSYAR